MGESTQAIVLESVVALAFIIAAATGLKSSLWVVAVALAAHGIFDWLHGMLISNPGVPAFWPAFLFDLRRDSSRLSGVVAQEPGGRIFKVTYTGE